MLILFGCTFRAMVARTGPARPPMGLRTRPRGRPRFALRAGKIYLAYELDQTGIKYITGTLSAGPGHLRFRGPKGQAGRHHPALRQRLSGGHLFSTQCILRSSDCDCRDHFLSSGLRGAGGAWPVPGELHGSQSGAGQLSDHHHDRWVHFARSRGARGRELTSKANATKTDRAALGLRRKNGQSVAKSDSSRLGKLQDPRLS